jgi:hypothetical protein
MHQGCVSCVVEKSAAFFILCDYLTLSSSTFGWPGLICVEYCKQGGVAYIQLFSCAFYLLWNNIDMFCTWRIDAWLHMHVLFRLVDDIHVLSTVVSCFIQTEHPKLRRVSGNQNSFRLGGCMLKLQLVMLF